MMRRLASEGARVSRALAALGACVLLTRFAVDAWAWAGEREEASASVAPRPRPVGAAKRAPPEAERLEGAGAARAPSAPAAPASSSTARRAVATQAKSIAPKRRTLFVDLGPPRSDVYVNGVAVGRTPYAGTWGCHDGDEVRIVVIWPGQAPPIQAIARCGPSIVADKGGENRKLDAKGVQEIMNDQAVAPALKDALTRRGLP